MAGGRGSACRDGYMVSDSQLELKWAAKKNSSKRHVEARGGPGGASRTNWGLPRWG